MDIENSEDWFLLWLDDEGPFIPNEGFSENLQDLLVDDWSRDVRTSSDYNCIPKRKIFKRNTISMMAMIDTNDILSPV